MRRLNRPIYLGIRLVQMRNFANTDRMLQMARVQARRVQGRGLGMGRLRSIGGEVGFMKVTRFTMIQLMCVRIVAGPLAVPRAPGLMLVHHRALVRDRTNWVLIRTLQISMALPIPLRRGHEQGPVRIVLPVALFPTQRRFASKARTSLKTTARL